MATQNNSSKQTITNKLSILLGGTIGKWLPPKVGTDTGCDSPPIPGDPTNTPNMTSATSRPHYSVDQYENHAPVVKQTNEWLLEDCRSQLKECQHRLREKENLLETKIKELAEKDTHLQLARHELAEKDTHLQITRQALVEKDTHLQLARHELAEKDTHLQLARQEINYLKEVSIKQFCLNMLSTLLFGYGINLVTSNPSVFPSWIMIIAAVVVQTISFAMTPRYRMQP